MLCQTPVHRTTGPQAKGPRSSLRQLCLALAILLLVLPGTAEAQNAAVIPQITGLEQIRETAKPSFPSFYFTASYSAYKAQEAARPYWAASEMEVKARERIQRENTSLLLNSDILAFYGHPLSRNMGILGRYPIAELDARLSKLAEEYAAASGGRQVRKAF
jgi:hypothetical protein